MRFLIAPVNLVLILYYFCMRHTSPPAVTIATSFNIRKFDFACLTSELTILLFDSASYAGSRVNSKFQNNVHCVVRIFQQLTRYDQQVDDNYYRYTMSRWASCASLKSPYDGPIRLTLSPSKCHVFAV